MPIYDYGCGGCGELWEEFLSYDNRGNPEKNPCPKCGNATVKKMISGFPGISTDSTLTPNKATGGKWSELMTRMKSGVPERMRGKMDKGDSGRRWN